MAKHSVHLKSVEEFQGRAWLTLEEWETYRRRPPVRYPTEIKKELIKDFGYTCQVCGAENVPEKELQIAHHLAFTTGVVDWGLTPEWLDSKWNVCLAHKVSCNNQFGLDPLEMPAFLNSHGLNLADSAPFKQGFISLVLGKNGTPVEIKYNN